MLRCTRSKIPTEVQRTHLCQLGSLAKFQQKPLQKKKKEKEKKKKAQISSVGGDTEQGVLFCVQE